MGLLNELNAINRTLEDHQKQLTKTQLKELDKLKKQRIKKIFLEQFEEAFAKTSSKKDIEILTTNLLKNKVQNILFVKNCYLDLYKQKFLKSDIDYIDQYYFKWIQDVSKEYLYIYKLEEREQKEEERQEQIKQKALEQEYIRKQQQKQINFNNTIIFLKTITLILLAPFILIIFFVIGLCKNVK